MKINIEKLKTACTELNNNERTKGLKLELKKVNIEPVESDVELYINIINHLKENDKVNYEKILDETYGLDEDYDFYKNEKELYEIFYLNPLREMVTSINKSGLLDKNTITTEDVKKVIVPQIYYNYKKNAFLDNPELVLSMLLQIIDAASRKIYKIEMSKFISVSDSILKQLDISCEIDDYIDAFNTIYSLFDLFTLDIEINPEDEIIKFGSKLLDCFETNLINEDYEFETDNQIIDEEKSKLICSTYLSYYTE